MRRIIRVGFDLDGVLAPLMETALPFLNFEFRRGKKPITMEDIVEHDISGVFGVSRERISEALFEIYKSNAFRDMKPYPDALELVKGVSDAYGAVPIITARPQELHDLTNNFVLDHFGDYVSGVFFTKPYVPTGEHRSKAELCVEQKLTHFVEDCYSNAVEIITGSGDESTRVKVFLVPKKHNTFNSERKEIPGLYRFSKREAVLPGLLTLPYY